MDLLSIIKSAAEEKGESAILLRRELHAHPELSFKEKETAGRIARELKDIGIEPHTNIAGTGVVGIIDGELAGPTIGIRADMDALPINEDTGLDFSSKNTGVMHACGHDVHMANLIGAAKILCGIRKQIKGKILLIFQPAEELLPGGAIGIMESEIFKKNKPDLMLGLHVYPELPSGEVGFRPGPYMASSDEIYLTIKGKGGHGALPHTLTDPVPIAAQTILSLQQVVSRCAPCTIPTVLSFGKVTANGATNIIPSEVQLEGTFRTMDEAWRAEARKKIEQIATNTSLAMGAECDVDIRPGYPALKNDNDSTVKAISAAKEYLGDNAVKELSIRMTADDFAYYTQQIPSVYFRLGIGFEGKEIAMLHNSHFTANDDALKYSIGLTAWIVASLMHDTGNA